MNTRTKRQHLVPRFYLNRFCDDEGMVWTYGANQKPRANKPENTAIETNIYSPVDKVGERFDDIEKVLADIEGEAAPLWGELMSGKVMCGEARRVLATFLAIQFLRSPMSIHAGAQLTGLLTHHIASVQLDSEMKKNSTEFAGNKAILEFLRDTSNYKIDVDRATGLGMLIGTEKLAYFLHEMKWTVGLSRKQHLITSDSPVTRISDPYTHDPIYGDLGFANKTVRVQFPLTPDMMLELCWGNGERERIVDIPKNLARQMNSVRAAQAKRFLNANQLDPGIQKLCDKQIGSKYKPIVKTGRNDPEIDVKRRLK